VSQRGKSFECLHRCTWQRGAPGLTALDAGEKHRVKGGEVSFRTSRRELSEYIGSHFSNKGSFSTLRCSRNIRRLLDSAEKCYLTRMSFRVGLEISV
jgi:hypothetical protein